MPEKLKKGWRTWRFDQMAVMINDRIDNPAEADVEHYVGLEHLDPESLSIQRWGIPSDVEATKLLFRKGDIIFGRRRVYQRKLAVAHFDGICSAHAMVLRSKPEVVLPEFLPFFMQSDLFMERAKQISVGSLSPTINWKTLAKEEFALPPIEEQKRIAEVLVYADCLTQGLQRSISAEMDVIEAMRTEFFEGQPNITNSMRSRSCQVARLGDCCEITSSKRIYASEYVEHGVPFYRGKEVIEKHHGAREVTTELYITEEKYSDLKQRFGAPEPGDVLITAVGTLGIPYVVNNQDRFYFKDGNLLWFRRFKGLSGEYLYHYLLSNIGWRQLQRSTIGTSQSALTIVRLAEIKMPLPSVAEQLRLVEAMKRCTACIEALKERIHRTMSLKSCVLQEF